MTKHRNGRISEEIKKSASNIIRTKIKDPRLATMISVTKVDLTRDYTYAKLFVSIFGNEKETKDSLDALKKSAGFIRKEIGKTVKMRHIPQILIQLDDGLDYSMNIERILKDIKSK